MISSHYFSIFPPFPREQTIFVIMSFHPMFDHRWKNVIEPACEGTGLTPYRVDNRMVSDSILTDINRGIANARLILVDITEMTQVKISSKDSQPYIVRNSNAMYEMGLAHAVRQPQEVLIFRSDNVQLPFDVSPIRVRSYDPDQDAEGAKSIVRGAIENAVKEIDQVNNFAVMRVTESLDGEAFQVLAIIAQHGYLDHPHGRTMGEILSLAHQVPAITRLLSLGVIRATHPENLANLIVANSPSVMMYRYVITPFGEGVIKAIRGNLNSVIEKNPPAGGPAKASSPEATDGL